MNKKVIDSFKDDYRFLSNFYGVPLTYKNVHYLNSESAYQAQKSIGHEEEFKNLEPNKAKALGRKIKIRPDWEEVKDEHMYLIVKAKFEQNPNVAKMLVNTGDIELIEGNWWGDQYWGISKGKGQNKLGHILMKVRNELKNKYNSQ